MDQRHSKGSHRRKQETTPTSLLHDEVFEPTGSVYEQELATASPAHKQEPTPTIPWPPTHGREAMPTTPANETECTLTSPAKKQQPILEKEHDLALTSSPHEASSCVPINLTHEEPNTIPEKPTLTSLIHEEPTPTNPAYEKELIDKTSEEQHEAVEVYKPPKKKGGKTVTVRAFCSKKIIEVSVHPGDKVSAVKQVIEEELHVPCDHQRLFVHDGELEDEDDVLSRVTDRFIVWIQRDIVLIQRDIDNVLFMVSVSTHSSIDNTASIIRFHSSRMHIVHFNSSDTVMDVKLKLHEAAHVGDIKRLTFQGRQLSDEEKLTDCNIQKQSTIHFEERHQYDLMEMNIKLLSGDPITLQVEKDGSESIKSVKLMIQEKLSMPVEEQQLRFEGKEMKDDRLLKDYNIKRDRKLGSQVVPTLIVAPRECHEIQLFLKTTPGHSNLVKAYPYDTIADLKASVQEKEGVPVDQQRLTFNGVHLEEGKLLSEYGILPECTLHLTTKLHSQFQIFIKTGRYGSTVTLEIESCDTIATLKNKIQDKIQVPSNRDFVLKCGEERLEDDNETIQHCGIERNSTLCLDYQHEYYTISGGVRIQVDYHWEQVGEILSDSWYTINAIPPCTPFQMPIFVRMDTPHAYAHMGYIAVGCLPTTTFKDVAFSIQSILKGMKALMSEPIFLTYNGEEMNKNHTLSDCGIQRGSVLHLKANVYIPSFTFPLKFAPPQPMSRFPIFVQKEGKRIPIAVQPHTTVADVMTAVERKEHISVSKQQYIFSGKLLEDKRFLVDYGIHRECTLRLVKQRDIMLFLKVPSGKTLTLHRNPSLSIRQFKASIQEACEIPIDQQQLTFVGKLLEDERSLRNYDIDSYCTLYVRLEYTHLINVKMISGNSISVDVAPSEMICNVKSKIHIREGTAPEHHELFFGDQKLKDDQTVKCCGIFGMDTLILVKSTDKASIFVKSITGEVDIVEYFPSKTVAGIKVELHDVRKIPPKNQSLFFSGVRLEESQTLSHYNIQEQTTIHLVPQFSDSFQVHVEICSERVISLQVSPIHTIENVKLMIWHRLGILPSEQCLYCDKSASQMQLSGRQCLSECKLEHQNTLFLLQKPCFLTVKNVTGEDIIQKWPNHPMDTIADIKLELCRREDVSAAVESIKLYLDVQELENSVHLSSYGVLSSLLNVCGYLQMITGCLLFGRHYTSGRTVALNYNPRNTIAQVREQVVECKGKQTVLTFDDSVLHDTLTLADCHVHEEDLLTLIPKSIVVFVTTETGMCTILDVNLLDSVEDVKSKIHQEWKLPPEQQKLSFGGFELSNGKALFSYNIQDEDTLSLSLHPCEQDQIAIEMPSKTIVLEVNLQQDTVEDLKAKIESIEGIPAAQQCLFLENLRMLSNDLSLADSGVYNHGALHLLLKPSVLFHRSVHAWQLHTGSWLTRSDFFNKVSFSLLQKSSNPPQVLFTISSFVKSDELLRDYNIHILSQLHPKASLLNKRVFVKEYDSGKVIALEYDANETVVNVKQKSCEMFGLNMSQCSLISRPGKVKQLGVHSIKMSDQLREESTLVGCNIKEGDIVDLVPYEITVLLHIEESEFIPMDIKILTRIKDLEEMIWNKQKSERNQLGMCMVDSSGRSLSQCHEDSTLYHMHIQNRDVLKVSIRATFHIGAPLPYPVFVKTAAGKTIFLKVNGSETTERLKGMIEQAEPATPAHLQRLIFNGVELKNELTLTYYGIGNAATIDLLVRGQSLLIKMHMGKTLALGYNPTDTVADVKMKIQKKNAILPARQKLILGGTGRELKDDEVLKDCNITAASTLNLILKRRMQIQITTLTGDTQSIMLDVQADDTLQSVKLLLQLYIRAPPEQQLLYLAGCELNDLMTLTDYQIQHRSTLHLVLLQLHVRAPSGEEVVVRYNESETVAGIKAQLYAETRTLPQEQRLLFCDQELEDQHTLGHYSIKNGQTLYLEHVKGGLCFM